MPYEIYLRGLVPILFNRYLGKEVELPTERKAYYLDEKEKILMIPCLNIFSMLANQNCMSAVKLLGGKRPKELSSAIYSYIRIEPFEIPLIDEKGETIKFTGFDGKRFLERFDVARVNKGIPVEVKRFQLNPPWGLRFKAYIKDNPNIDAELLRSLLERAGSQIGLGCFRPLFGRFELKEFKRIQDKD